MSGKVEIKFDPKGFAACLKGLTGTVQSEAEKIAARATSYLSRGSGFHVEMSDEAKYKDSSYGVTRPVARVVANDKESSIEEAKKKILSKAVGK